LTELKEGSYRVLESGLSLGCGIRQLNQSIAHTRPKSNIMVEEFKRGGRLRTKAPKIEEGGLSDIKLI